VTATGETRMKMHETANSWVVSKSEHYNKQTGRRNGSPTPKRLLLNTIEPIAQ
jgi:hypothetical protein